MQRREFLGLLGGAAAWPVAARAQPKPPVVSLLHSGAASADAHYVDAFRQGLKETGAVEGRNVAFEVHWAEGRYERLPALAADLVRRQVAVIATGGGVPSVRAAKAATSTIPIVFVMGGDPVKSGLVASLNRPGSNLTGVNIFTTELDAKRLGLLHELLPAGAVIAHLANPAYPPAAAGIKSVEAAALKLGRKITVLNASTAGEIDAAFATMSQMKVGAVHVGADPFFSSRREQIVSLAARYALPANYQQRPFVEAGGLMSYGTDFGSAYHQMGVYAGRVLKGEKPADLPVVQASKFSLAINLKTAKALGLALPSGILSIADEVIE